MRKNSARSPPPRCSLSACSIDVPRGPPALGHGERRQRQHPLGLVPLGQSRRDVPADDQVQLVLWRVRVQLCKGIDRV